MSALLMGAFVTKPMKDDEQKELVKEALKEGMKEWLDGVFMTFGKWSLISLGALLLASFVFFILTMHGWKLN